ncbi:PREDICTED: uncharacterized protein LOC106808392 isoform X2 [Priapulus caudatus]|uniref:Uncharacterized protein LOC106808392 isoform X2 n=1 Tax=Priapulus caudatus TaxID=37621 RepID=A0ABM1E324_PRICU|nr:PREDICTED: uncharacterized protein LOC106808392 isoform X2 [Priapulus caudatus]
MATPNRHRSKTSDSGKLWFDRPILHDAFEELFKASPVGKLISTTGMQDNLSLTNLTTLNSQPTLKVKATEQCERVMQPTSITRTSSVQQMVVDDPVKLSSPVSNNQSSILEFFNQCKPVPQQDGAIVDFTDDQSDVDENLAAHISEIVESLSETEDADGATGDKVVCSHPVLTTHDINKQHIKITAANNYKPKYKTLSRYKDKYERATQHETEQRNRTQCEKDQEKVAQHEKEQKNLAQHNKEPDMVTQHENDQQNVAQHKEQEKVAQSEKKQEKMMQHRKEQEKVMQHVKEQEKVAQSEKKQEKMMQHRKEEKKVVQHEKEEEKMTPHEKDQEKATQHQNMRKKCAANECKPTFLYNWTIMKAGNGKTGKICLEGSKEKLSNGDEIARYWHSAAIVKRVTAKVVQTISGSTYRLSGPLSKVAWTQPDMTVPVLKAFATGFPLNWKEVIKNHYYKRYDSDDDDDCLDSTSILCTSVWNDDKLQVADLPQSRSGRTVIPPLAYWTGSRVMTNQWSEDGHVTIHVETADHLTPTINYKSRFGRRTSTPKTNTKMESERNDSMGSKFNVTLTNVSHRREQLIDSEVKAESSKAVKQRKRRAGVKSGVIDSEVREESTRQSTRMKRVRRVVDSESEEDPIRRLRRREKRATTRNEVGDSEVEKEPIRRPKKIEKTNSVRNDKEDQVVTKGLVGQRKGRSKGVQNEVAGSEVEEEPISRPKRREPLKSERNNDEDSENKEELMGQSRRGRSKGVQNELAGSEVEAEPISRPKRREMLKSERNNDEDGENKEELMGQSRRGRSKGMQNEVACSEVEEEPIRRSKRREPLTSERNNNEDSENKEELMGQSRKGRSKGMQNEVDDNNVEEEPVFLLRGRKKGKEIRNEAEDSEVEKEPVRQIRRRAKRATMRNEVAGSEFEEEPIRRSKRREPLKSERNNNEDSENKEELMGQSRKGGSKGMQNEVDDNDVEEEPVFLLRGRKTGKEIRNEAEDSEVEEEPVRQIRRRAKRATMRNEVGDDEVDKEPVFRFSQRKSRKRTRNESEDSEVEKEPIRRPKKIEKTNSVRNDKEYQVVTKGIVGQRKGRSKGVQNEVAGSEVEEEPLRRSKRRGKRESIRNAGVCDEIEEKRTKQRLEQKRNGVLKKANILDNKKHIHKQAKECGTTYEIEKSRKARVLLLNESAGEELGQRNRIISLCDDDNDELDTPPLLSWRHTRVPVVQDSKVEMTCAITETPKASSRTKSSGDGKRNQYVEKCTSSTRGSTCNQLEADKNAVWDKKDVSKLERTMLRFNPSSRTFWNDVANYMGNRTAMECHQFYYEDDELSDEKKSMKKAKAPALITAKKGTMKRKRQMRDMLEQHDEGYSEDDLFDSTPFRNNPKKAKASLVEGDSFMDSLSASTMKSFMRTPGERAITWVPPSKKKTPKFGSFTTPVVFSANINQVDRYIHKYQGRRFDHATPEPSKLQSATSQHSKDINNAAAKNVLENKGAIDYGRPDSDESEEELDHYWSDA